MTNKRTEKGKRGTPKTSPRRRARRQKLESRKVKDRETKSAAAPPSKWRKLKASVFGQKLPSFVDESFSSGDKLFPFPLERVEQRDPPAPAPEIAPVPEPEAPPSAEEKTDSRKKKQHGSQKRQMEKTVAARLTPSEYAAIAEKSASAGLSLSAYARACLLGDPGLRAKRAPPLNRVALGEAIAALNRVGNNLNQIAHHLNAGGHPDRAAIAASNGKLDACLSAISKTLGRAE